MPDIRPVQFPSIIQQNEPAGKTKPAKKAEQSPLEQIFVNAGSPKGAGSSRLTQMTQPVLSDPVEKAKAAMLKFYQPEKQAAKKTAPLGQVIDIKV